MKVILNADPSQLTAAASVAKTALARLDTWPTTGRAGTRWDFLLYEKGDQGFVVTRHKSSITVYHRGDSF